MITFAGSFAFCFLSSFVTTTCVVADADGLRGQAPRLRHPGHTSFQASPIANLIPDYNSLLKSIAKDPAAAVHAFIGNEKKANPQVEELDTAMKELDTILTSQFFMSMPPTNTPSTTTPTTGPTNGLTPDIGGANPGTGEPTASPTDVPTVSASTPPPTGVPTATPTAFPTTVSPTTIVTTAPTPPAPTGAPSIQKCGISEEARIAVILQKLDEVADPVRIRDNGTPQGLATSWLLGEDAFLVCPDDQKLIQRWALAVIYFSTGGDSWFQCSANPQATDACGAEDPFVGETRFLSPVGECLWAGISCIDGCITEIEFEENNLVGTIPTELGLLKDLAVWGMERGGLTGSIPTQVGQLTNLIFIDLDFNALTGSLSAELLSLTNLQQLDLNNNQMTGSVSGIGVFPDLEFLQLHDNLFTGTIPEALGQSIGLTAFTLHETGIGGTMPESVCNLLPSNGGVLGSLIADCSEPNPDIVCTCCTDCRDT